VQSLGVAAETHPSVSDLLGQVQATYDKMHSYSSVGEITSKVFMPGLGSQEGNYTFSIKLARPNLYRIEWEQHSPNMNTSGTAWSAGAGNFVAVPGRANPMQPKDMTTAFSMATGISGGAAATIPPIFFNLNYNSLKGLDAAFGPDADIEGDPCYVISGKAKTSGVTMWISRKSKLIRQIRDDLSGQMKIPDLTDEQAKSAIESMGQTPTAEAIKRMKEQMNSMRAMMGPGTTWTSIQVQRQIVVNAAMSKADFAPKSAPAAK
jgi:outer membrane lipoprotein-sorting protein